MHNLIASFFAIVFSLGAHAPAHPSDAFVPPVEYAGGINYAVPSRHDILNGYPEAGCHGCRMTTNTSYAR